MARHFYPYFINEAILFQMHNIAPQSTRKVPHLHFRNRKLVAILSLAQGKKIIRTERHVDLL